MRLTFCLSGFTAGKWFMSPPRRVRVPRRFVAKLVWMEGTLWLSCTEDCTDARGSMRRLLREGVFGEHGIKGLGPALVLSFERPESECTEVHVDFVRGIVMDVRVTRQGEVVTEDVVGVQFIEEFSRGVDRAFSETDVGDGVRP